MGQRASVSALKKKEVKELMSTTHFESDEINALHNHFRGIAKSEEGMIDRKEFQFSLGIKDSLFLDRMFQLFDGNNDGLINFTEYLTGLSVLSSRGTLEEKVKFSFEIYDFDGDGKISKSELTQMLQASLNESAVELSSAQLTAIVEATFKEADLNRDNYIDFDEYRRIVDAHPSILSNMTLDFRKVIEMRAGDLARQATS